jgi:thymidylate synthase (FAD)
VKVELLSWSDNLAACEEAAAVCVRAKDKPKALRMAIRAGHESVIEHMSFTFRIMGVSRVTLAQITRHRIASYSVESQRYTDASRGGVICPESIRESEFYPRFQKLVEDSHDLYRDMTEGGIPKEDARYALPEGSPTCIVHTMNARELRHFFTLRCCNRAQWEIREVANRMLQICQEKAPSVFKDAGSDSGGVRSVTASSIFLPEDMGKGSFPASVWCRFYIIAPGTGMGLS